MMDVLHARVASLRYCESGKLHVARLSAEGLRSGFCQIVCRGSEKWILPDCLQEGLRSGFCQIVCRRV